MQPTSLSAVFAASAINARVAIGSIGGRHYHIAPPAVAQVVTSDAEVPPLVQVVVRVLRQRDAAASVAKLSAATGASEPDVRLALDMLRRDGVVSEVAFGAFALRQ